MLKDRKAPEGDLLNTTRARFNVWYNGEVGSGQPQRVAYAHLARGFVTNFSQHVIAHVGDVLVINKPAGLLSHVGNNGRDFGVGELVGLATGNPDAGNTHRLDGQTSGVMIIGENSNVRRSLSNQFEAREVQKTYLALVVGDLPEELAGIIGPLRKNQERRTAPMEVSLEDDAKLAATLFRPILKISDPNTGQRFTLVEVGLHKSGRTHQIRAHLREIGFPIVGDSGYNDDPSGAERQLLHAHKITIRTPRTQPEEGKRLTFSAPMPPDFVAFIEGMQIEETSDRFDELVLQV